MLQGFDASRTHSATSKIILLQLLLSNSANSGGEPQQLCVDT